MPVTIEGEVTGAIGAAGGTVTIPGTPQQNDIVLLSRVCDGALNAAVISESDYNEIVENPTNNNPGRACQWKRMGATPDSSITVAGEGTFAQSYICRLYRGVDTTTAIDNTPTHASGATGTPDCANYNTATNGARRILVGFLDDDSAAASAEPTGYGSLATSNNTGRSLMQAERDEATAGADDPGTWTTGGNDEWYALHFAFRPATGGGPTYTLTAAAGSFAMTGFAAGLIAARVLAAASGSFAMTGNGATLTYMPPGGYNLVADAGIFTFTGNAANLNYSGASAGPPIAGGGVIGELIRGVALEA